MNLSKFLAKRSMNKNNRLTTNSSPRTVHSALICSGSVPIWDGVHRERQRLLRQLQFSHIMNVLHGINLSRHFEHTDIRVLEHHTTSMTDCYPCHPQNTTLGTDWMTYWQFLTQHLRGDRAFLLWMGSPPLFFPTLSSYSGIEMSSINTIEHGKEVGRTSNGAVMAMITFPTHDNSWYRHAKVVVIEFGFSEYATDIVATHARAN